MRHAAGKVIDYSDRVLMFSALRKKLQGIRSALWFRPTATCLLAVIVAVAVAFVDNYVPRGALPWIPELDRATVAELLRLLAGAMLTVTTVTLSVLMLVLSQSSGQASPRTVPELLADRVTQNAFSTFLATFVFSLTALLLMGLNDIAEAGLSITFVITLALVAAVIRYFIKWIDHVANALKLTRVVARVHRQAETVLEAFLASPTQADQPVPLPFDTAGSSAIAKPETGYVQLIDFAALDDLAAEHDLRIRLEIKEGSFVHQHRPLLRVQGLDESDERLVACLRDTVVVGFERSHEADPMLGFELLSEVAVRALSPGINDPQTAITTVGYLSALLHCAAKVPPDRYPASSRAEGRVTMPKPNFASMLHRAFRPIARDGAGFAEVTQVLMGALRDLAADCEPAYLDDIDKMRQRAVDFARERQRIEADKTDLDEASAQIAEIVAARRADGADLT